MKNKPVYVDVHNSTLAEAINKELKRLIREFRARGEKPNLMTLENVARTRAKKARRMARNKSFNSITISK
jgi:hypothetical protein